MPSPDDMLFGQIAARRYMAKAEHINLCLQIQATDEAAGAPRRTLGQILVDRGFITAAQVDLILEAQRELSGPKMIGKYQIIGKIGEGGMGAVYKALVPSTGLEVALKILPKKFSSEQSYVTRFRREASVGMGLDHPNIVHTFDVGDDKGVHFIALELVAGGDLENRIKQRGIFADNEALGIIREVALGLQHAHEKGLVHRDIKPPNILFDADGHAKLSDLGLVKMSDPETSHLTQSGMVVGTPHYIAPEQARGESDIDVRADIYALGATLYRLVTGKTPFEGSNALEIITKHLNQELVAPDEVNPTVGDGCTTIIEKMMAKARNDRYTQPADLIRDIDRVLAGQAPESGELEIGKSSVQISAKRRARNPSPRSPLLRGEGEKAPRHAPPAPPLLAGEGAGGRGAPARIRRSSGAVQRPQELIEEPAPAASHAPKPSRTARRPSEQLPAEPQPAQSKKGGGILLWGIGAGAAGLLLIVGLAITFGSSNSKPSEPKNKVADSAQPANPDPPKNPQPVAPPPVAPAPKRPTEELAQEAFTALTRFEGLKPDDTAGRVKRVDQFIEQYRDSIVASRARILLNDIKNPPFAKEKWIVRHPRDAVWWLAFTPDSTGLATAGRDGAVRLWDIQARNQKASFPGNDTGAWSLAISPDGKTLAAGDFRGAVRIWDVESHKLRSTLTHASAGQVTVKAVAFSPNGKWLATTGFDKIVKLWNAQDLSPVWSKETGIVFICGLSFSPDSRSVAVGGDNTTVIFEAGTGKELTSLNTPGSASIFSPDGKILATSTKNEPVKLWDTGDWHQSGTIGTAGDWCGWALAFSPDGKMLATPAGGNTVKLWDLQSRTELALLRGHSSAIFGVAFSPDGRSVATCSDDGSAWIWSFVNKPGGEEAAPHKVVAPRNPEPDSVTGPAKPGALATYYEHSGIDSLANFDMAKARLLGAKAVDTIDIPNEQKLAELFGSPVNRLVIFTGFIQVPADGEWTFYLTSDDGSLLSIGASLIVDNDGEHPAFENSAVCGLKAGKHAFTLKYFQGGGVGMLAFAWSGPNTPRQTVPAAALSHGDAPNATEPAKPAVAGGIDSGLLAHWKLDDANGMSAADATGNVNTATLKGGCAWTPNGKLGGALSFNGKDAYADYSSQPGLNFAANAPFTYTAWVKTTENYGPIFSQRNSANQSAAINICIGFAGATDGPGCISAYVLSDAGNNAAQVSGAKLNDGNWHLVSLSRNAAGQIQLFMDGASQGAATGGDSAGPITTNLRALGSERHWVQFNNANGRQFLKGSLADARIYNRELKGAEIKALYDETTNGAKAPPLAPGAKREITLFNGKDLSNWFILNTPWKVENGEIVGTPLLWRNASMFCKTRVPANCELSFTAEGKFYHISADG